LDPLMVVYHYFLMFWANVSLRAKDSCLLTLLVRPLVLLRFVRYLFTNIFYSFLYSWLLLFSSHLFHYIIYSYLWQGGDRLNGYKTSF
jgi:hypothetical protein